MKSTDNPSLEDLQAEFANNPAKQMRVDKSGEIYTKVDSDRSGLLARLSGQEKKFEAAEQVVCQAFERSIGMPPNQEQQAMIHAAVRGEGGRQLNAALLDIKRDGLTMALQQSATPEKLAEYGAKAMEAGVPAKTIYSAIENSNFTAAEKQRAHLAVADQAIKNECAELSPGQNTLLRGNGEGPTYLSTYMKEHAGAFNAAVLDRVNQGVSQIALPAADGQVLDKADVPKAGANAAGRTNLTPQQQADWDAAYEQAGQLMVDSVQAPECLAQLSPEAKEMLEQVHESAMRHGDPATAEVRARTAVISTTTLRASMAHVTSTEGPKAGRADLTPDERARAQFIVNSAAVGQAFMNSVDVPRNQVLDQSKSQNVIAERMRTDQNVDSFKTFVGNLGGANQAQALQQQNAVQAAAPTTREGLRPNARPSAGPQPDVVKVQEAENAQNGPVLNNKDAENVIPKGNLQNKMKAFLGESNDEQGIKANKESKSEENKVKAEVGWKKAEPSVKEGVGVAKLK